MRGWGRGCGQYAAEKHFLTELEGIGEDRGESFHQDTATAEKIIDSEMESDYAGSLHTFRKVREAPDVYNKKIKWKIF
jgi:hypothetical protein